VREHRFEKTGCVNARGEVVNRHPCQERRFSVKYGIFAMHGARMKTQFERGHVVFVNLHLPPRDINGISEVGLILAIFDLGDFAGLLRRVEIGEFGILPVLAREGQFLVTGTASSGAVMGGLGRNSGPVASLNNPGPSFRRWAGIQLANLACTLTIRGSPEWFAPHSKLSGNLTGPKSFRISRVNHFASLDVML